DSQFRDGLTYFMADRPDPRLYRRGQNEDCKSERLTFCKRTSMHSVTLQNTIGPNFRHPDSRHATRQLDLEASDLILLIMPADSAQTALERVLAAVGQCLDRLSAESLLRLRADTEMQGRIEELADKCTE